jgi:hypothetical protein
VIEIVFATVDHSDIRGSKPHNRNPLGAASDYKRGFGPKTYRIELSRILYRRRGRIVEFCHAWIKSKLGLRQFRVRGLKKVQMEMLWACLTYNL